ASNLSSVPLAIPLTVTVRNSQDQDESLNLGFANSIAVYGNWLAVAVENKIKTAAGAVLFFDISAAPVFRHAVQVGALPDMLTFSADGTKVLVANEGEPSADYQTDPEGSVSVILLNQQQPALQAQHIDFKSFNNQKTQLAAKGIKFASPANTTVAQDLEPEYITLSVDQKKAYVALQENNALAVLNLTNNTVEKLLPLGFKDHSQSKNALDVSNRDGVNLVTVPKLYGMYQPDTLASYSWKNTTFIVSANEGDARDYPGYSEQARVASLTRSDSLLQSQAQLYSATGLGRLNISTAMGQNGAGAFDALYAFGARSFSIWDQNGLLVFDSGNDFERISSALHGDKFNSNHLTVEGDNRSDDKGPEPEALALGQVGDRTYAFIGTERMSSLLIYDISNPYTPQFVDYVLNRDLNAQYSINDDVVPAQISGNVQQAGDLGPESIVFVDAAKSPTKQALLLVANEVSGSVTLYQVTKK
ncbi:choice-of-anchor I family protein, partial [Rheinheimera sp.]|uniref:choice-of-anchor I family protein n=1 Tax=Rheinheimera sp. TaxID=1869214 RepID=UPI0027BA56DF